MLVAYCTRHKSSKLSLNPTPMFAWDFADILDRYISIVIAWVTVKHLEGP